MYDVLLLWASIVPSWVEEYPERLLARFVFKLTDGVKSVYLFLGPLSVKNAFPSFFFNYAFADTGNLLNSSKLVSLYIFL